MEPLAQTLLFAGLAGAAGASLIAPTVAPAAKDVLIRPWAIAGAGLALVASASLLILRYVDVLTPTAAAFGRDTFQQYLETEVGAAQLVQLGLTILALVAALGAPRIIVGAASLAAAASIGATGHFRGFDSEWPMAVMAVHLVAAQLWLGAIGVLAVGIFALRMPLGAIVERAMRFAALAMALALATGVVAAALTLDDWPALLGTASGHLLLLKLLSVAAAVAVLGLLRRWMRRPTAESASPKRMVATVASLALGIVVLAAFLAGEIPGAHDDILWPFPIRPNAEVALQNPGAVLALWGGGAQTAAALKCAVVWCADGRPVAARLASAFVVLFGAAHTTFALSVEAYPTTYLHPDQGLELALLDGVQPIYAEACAGCHGAHGEGDGALAADLPVPPANLTAAHVGDHTMGDMYWWVSRGLSGVMPGFKSDYSERQIWALVHYAHLLSLGEEARALPAPPDLARPFLPAIDVWLVRFDGDRERLVAPDGGRPTLLLFGSGASKTFRALSKAGPGIERAGGRIVLSPPGAVVAAPTGLRRLRDPAKSWSFWRHYRRSIKHPDVHRTEKDPEAVLFVIDRWGFVRARWRSDEGAPPTAASLEALMRKLAKEPKQRDWRDHDR